MRQGGKGRAGALADRPRRETAGPWVGHANCTTADSLLNADILVARDSIASPAARVDTGGPRRGAAGAVVREGGTVLLGQIQGVAGGADGTDQVGSNLG